MKGIVVSDMLYADDIYTCTSSTQSCRISKFSPAILHELYVTVLCKTMVKGLISYLMQTVNVSVFQHRFQQALQMPCNSVIRVTKQLCEISK